MPSTAPLVSLKDIELIGTTLSRPECVLTMPCGDIYVSDLRGGISKIDSMGAESQIIAHNVPSGFVTNGFTITPKRTFLLANMGDGGGVWQLSPDNKTLTLMFDVVDGLPMTHTNFVGRDRNGRYWITVTTQQKTMTDCLNSKSNDGFIILMDEKGPRVVADGLCVANEAKVDPTGRWLYVNETFGRRLSRFEIRPDSTLGPRETVVDFVHVFPDGLAHDTDGGVWIASLISNRIVRVVPETGSQEIILEDRNDEIIQRCEQLFQSGKTFTRAEIDVGRFSVLGSAPSVTFGGEDLRTVYVGSLNDRHIAKFRTHYTGLLPAHWD